MEVKCLFTGWIHHAQLLFHDYRGMIYLLNIFNEIILFLKLLLFLKYYIITVKYRVFVVFNVPIQLEGVCNVRESLCYTELVKQLLPLRCIGS